MQNVQHIFSSLYNHGVIARNHRLEKLRVVDRMAKGKSMKRLSIVVVVVVVVVVDGGGDGALWVVRL